MPKSVRRAPLENQTRAVCRNTLLPSLVSFLRRQQQVVRLSVEVRVAVERGPVSDRKDNGTVLKLAVSSSASSFDLGADWMTAVILCGARLGLSGYRRRDRSSSGLRSPPAPFFEIPISVWNGMGRCNPADCNHHVSFRMWHFLYKRTR
jgi:hypothetical protein